MYRLIPTAQIVRSATSSILVECENVEEGMDVQLLTTVITRLSANANRARTTREPRATTVLYVRLARDNGIGDEGCR